MAKPVASAVNRSKQTVVPIYGIEQWQFTKCVLTLAHSTVGMRLSAALL